MTCPWPATFFSPILHSPKKEFGSDLFHKGLFLCCSLGCGLWCLWITESCQMDWNILLQPLPWSNHHVWERQNYFPHIFRKVQLQDIYALVVLKDWNNLRRKKKLRAEQHHSENDTRAHPEYRARVVCTPRVWMESNRGFSLPTAHLCLMLQENRLSSCAATDNHPL